VSPARFETARGSEKDEQNLNSQEAVLTSCESPRCRAMDYPKLASFEAGPDGYSGHEGPDHRGRAVRLSARLATVRGFGQLGASLETVIRI
jgi:hypothetical protein